MNPIVIFITCANNKEARRIATALIKNRLAACINIADKIESIFWWEGKINLAKESLLIIKSRKTNLTKIVKRVKSMHSYSVPEIIALPVVAGNKDYFRWLNESVR